MRSIFLLLILICTISIASAMHQETQEIEITHHSSNKTSVVQKADPAMQIGLLVIENAQASLSSNDQKTISKKKTIAITLAITLGVFGAHRLYLGTSTKIPIIYTLTLGGGFGVLMVADIIAIIAAKDLSTYSPNPKIFMWAK